MPWGWLSPPSVYPPEGDRISPAGAYLINAAPPKLPIQTVPSGVIAAPHAPPFMPPPSMGLPSVGRPAGSRTLTLVLPFCVPGCQLVLDQTLPFASIAIRPEA